MGYFPNLGDIEVAAAEWDWLYTCASLTRRNLQQQQRGYAESGQCASILSTHDLRHPLILPDPNWGTNDPVVLWENEIIRIISTLGRWSTKVNPQGNRQTSCGLDALVDATLKRERQLVGRKRSTRPALAVVAQHRKACASPRT